MVLVAQLRDEQPKPALEKFHAVVAVHRARAVYEEREVARRQGAALQLLRLHAEPQQLVRLAPRTLRKLAVDGYRVAVHGRVVVVAEVVDVFLKPHRVPGRQPLLVHQVPAHQRVAGRVDVKRECRERIAPRIRELVLVVLRIALGAVILLDGLTHSMTAAGHTLHRYRRFYQGDAFAAIGHTLHRYRRFYQGDAFAAIGHNGLDWRRTRSHDGSGDVEVYLDVDLRLSRGLLAFFFHLHAQFLAIRPHLCVARLYAADILKPHCLMRLQLLLVEHPRRAKAYHQHRGEAPASVAPPDSHGPPTLRLLNERREIAA